MDGKRNLILTDGGKAGVRRALHERRDGRRHGVHAVEHLREQGEIVAGKIVRERFLGDFRGRDGNLCVRIGRGAGDCLGERMGIERFENLFGVLFRHGDHGGAGGGDGIVGAAAAEGGETRAGAHVERGFCRARGNADGVGELQMDGSAGVTADETGNGDLQRPAGSGFPLGGAVHAVHIAARARIAERAELFPVEIDEIFGVEVLRIEMVRAGHAVLFVHGEDCTDRAVYGGLVLENGHGERNARAVVAAEGRALGSERFAVVDNGDGVIERIKVHAVLPDDDHIHVRLQNGARRVLMSGGTGLVDNDVALPVAHGGETLFYRPVVEKLADLFLVMGFVRDGAE